MHCLEQWYSTEIEFVATESGYGVVPVATIGKFKIKAKSGGQNFNNKIHYESTHYISRGFC